MAELETRPPRSKALRAALVVGGVVTVTVAGVADRVGYGIPGSFGSGQWLLLLVGSVIVLVGLVGRKIVDVYRSLAVLLLNTLALFAGLELVAIVIARLGILPSPRQVMLAESQAAPYYATQPWAKAYWQEAQQAESYRYRPYVVWGHRPFNGETINISEEGIRKTPGADCGPDSYTVFAFGGSSMWGWGSPDWGTIAAFLQTGLDDMIQGSVCVVNFGEDGFVSTQNLVALMLQLQSGRVPDAAIFYAGVNEVYAAYESGQPDVHPSLAHIAAEFEEPEHPLVSWLKATRQYSLYQQMFFALRDVSATEEAFGTDMDLETDSEELAVAVTQSYLRNYQLVSALAQEYGFEYFFFWQPHLGVDGKPLTAEEQALRAAMDPGLIKLASEVYERIYDSAPGHEHLWVLAAVFEGEAGQIWIDIWGHVTPEGNRLVAEEMITNIGGQLADR